MCVCVRIRNKLVYMYVCSYACFCVFVSNFMCLLVCVYPCMRVCKERLHPITKHLNRETLTIITIALTTTPPTITSLKGTKEEREGRNSKTADGDEPRAYGRAGGRGHERELARQATGRDGRQPGMTQKAGVI